MATTAPPAPNSEARPDTDPFLIPPEETIWVRYSPHHEAPLSFLGSGALHLLVLMVVGVSALLGIWWFKSQANPLPVSAVRMGGGGGSPTGKGDGPGFGTGGEDVAGPDNRDPSGDAVQRPPLDVEEMKQTKVEFADDPTAQRYIEEGNENLKKIARLNPDARNKMRDGLTPGKGQGGTGEGGGRGTGQGPGKGPGKGAGRELNQREKRMVRWTMVFETRSGEDYVEQLRDLGSIIAVPTGPGRAEYKFCDLTKFRGPRYEFADGDLSTMNRIWWQDDQPQAVRSLTAAMGWRGRADHFIAFMSPEVEEKLAKLEHNFKGLNEEQIHETRFRFVRGAGGKYDLKVISQTPNR
jgi:hypothetical protein